MNIRRIPIALFILFGVCAALAYLVGSIRPFAPGAKFSNIPPTLQATKEIAAVPPPAATNPAVEVAPPAPSDTPTIVATKVASPAPSNTPTTVVTKVVSPAPSDTPTIVVTKVASVAPSGTPTIVVTAVASVAPSGTSRIVVTKIAQAAPSNTATKIPVTILPPPPSRVATRAIRVALQTGRTNTPTRIPTLTPGVTRIAQATEPPTETPVPDAESIAATETAAPAQQTLSSVATQTSVLAQQTLSAISTRAFLPPAVSSADPNRAINKTTNFLLIGTDSRTDDPTWVPNTDVMMVLFLDTANQRAALLSLPRDLVVAIPRHQAFRINSAYHRGWATEGVEGGINVLKQILRDDFEIRIDHWALIDFDGLNQIIDMLGGIEVNVPCALTDTIDLQPFTIPAGNVQMDYLTAKRYVQSRYTTSDTSRNHRQQRVVWAMAKKALAMNAPDRVPLLYETLRENVATDMNLFNMIGLVPAVYQLDLQNHPERLRARVLEAPAVYPWVSTSGAWLYMPNYDLIQQELDEIFEAPQVAMDEVTRAECPTFPATPQPTDVPTLTPSAEATPTVEVTETPVVEAAPTEMPTEAPTVVPTEAPTQFPTEVPTELPTEVPTEVPTETPVAQVQPTGVPAAVADATATEVPTETPVS